MASTNRTFWKDLLISIVRTRTHPETAKDILLPTGFLPDCKVEHAH